MPSFWEKLRKDFPIVSKSLCLDHAAGGPIPKPVLAEIQTFYRENAEESDLAWMRWVRRREEARAAVARFIHAEPEEIAFTASTSEGMNAIADMLASEGEILTNTAEFPSSTVPWLWRGAKLRWQEPVKGVIGLEALRKHLAPSVKTILSSYVQFSSGFRQDLEALGKLKGRRYLVVNATQGFGALPIDVRKWNADFLCTNSYKWLMAGYGGGVLYVRKDLLAKFRPRAVGWRSMEVPERMDNRRLDLKREASRYELGCPPFPGIFAVGAAVRYFLQIGPEKIERRILELTDYVIAGLRKRGLEILTPLEPSQRSGIVVFRAGNAEQLWRRLLARKIYVSPRGGGLRIAPHFYNTFEDIDRFFKYLGAVS